jgi:hypothetical protein
LIRERKTFCAEIGWRGDGAVPRFCQTVVIPPVNPFSSGKGHEASLDFTTCGWVWFSKTWYRT